MMGSVTSANLMYGMTGYNGLGYYGDYGMTGYMPMYQNNLEYNYDMWQTQNGYSSKPGVEAMTINNQCQDIGVLLAQGRADDASKEIETMVADLRQYPQYAHYSDKEIRSVVRSLYQSATGSDLLTDIDANTSSSFVQGLKEGCVLGGIIANRTTKADLTEQVTGVKKAKGDAFGEIAGSVLSGAASYALVGLVCGGHPIIGAVVGATLGLIKAITPAAHKAK